jgi:hypothetical protein
MMEYRINVAKFQQSYGENRYIYLFHTTMDSLSGAEKAYNEIKAKFPNPEYSVTLTVWEKSGREVDGDEFFARMHSN